jgi:hypothetical protein
MTATVNQSMAVPKICFVPIWYPLEGYATSRLRAKYVAELLADHDQHEVRLDYQPDADIAVMVQLCSDENLRRVSANRQQLVVYDICDRFFETDALFRTEEGLLSARRRCLELIERADVLIAPTQQLIEELSRRFPGRPCRYVPELIDYGASPQPVTKAGSRRLLWFGNTTRGNFESAEWMIDHLRSRHGYQLVLVTSPRRIAKDYPAYRDFYKPWSPATLRRELARAELCIVSHAADEPGKSPNRFVTATMHGVPTLVSGSPSCIDILEAVGYGDFAIDTPADIDNAVEMLSHQDRREAYVLNLQNEMWLRHGPETVRRAYLHLFQKLRPSARQPR